MLISKMGIQSVKPHDSASSSRLTMTSDTV